MAALVGAAIMLLPRGFPGRWVGISGFLPMFLVQSALLAEGEFRLTVLDVGHGLAVAAQTRNHALLFDTGPTFGPQVDSGDRVAVLYLRAVGVHTLDTLIVSHDDADHYGGAASVLAAMPVTQLLSSLPDADTLQFHIDDAYRCYAGQNWVWDDVQIEILHSSRASYDDPKIKDNNRGCVLRIVTRSGAVPLPADIQSPSEGALLANSRDK